MAARLRVDRPSCQHRRARGSTRCNPFRDSGAACAGGCSPTGIPAGQPSKGHPRFGIPNCPYRLRAPRREAGVRDFDTGWNAVARLCNTGSAAPPASEKAQSRSPHSSIRSIRPQSRSPAELIPASDGAQSPQRRSASVHGWRKHILQCISQRRRAARKHPDRPRDGRNRVAVRFQFGA